MQGVDDTVDMVVVTTIVDELNADARNMRHIYPYNYLVAQGACCPQGFDHEQQKAFYNCFAAKVNATYATMDQFFNAILADTSDMSQIRRLESQCANDLFQLGGDRGGRDRDRSGDPGGHGADPGGPENRCRTADPGGPGQK